MPITLLKPTPAPHVAIIMDGNGRWAQARGWPRLAGHQAGVAAVRRTVAAAARQRVATLTLYAFSSDNWRRPQPEVQALLALLAFYLESERGALAQAGVRCSVIGRRDRLPAGLREAIAATEAATRGQRGLHLRLAIDYSSRDEIARAPRHRIAAHLEAGAGPVDLLIRTGGECRLSDFLLWESAYAELLFLRTAWPDFAPRHLRRALATLASRHRRYGALPTKTAGAGVSLAASS